MTSGTDYSRPDCPPWQPGLHERRAVRARLANRHRPRQTWASESAARTLLLQLHIPPASTPRTWGVFETRAPPFVFCVRKVEYTYWFLAWDLEFRKGKRTNPTCLLYACSQSSHEQKYNTTNMYLRNYPLGSARYRYSNPRSTVRLPLLPNLPRALITTSSSSVAAVLLR